MPRSHRELGCTSDWGRTMSAIGAAHEQEPIAVRAAWPLFGLQLRHGELTLRVVTDADALALAAIVESGVPPTDQEHFLPILGQLEDTARTWRRPRANGSG
jgi:hypothetical protein